jgi:hypothetical protein
MLTGSVLKKNCDVKILANFASKIAKLVEITLEKHIYPEFPTFSCGKKAKIRSKTRALLTSVVAIFFNKKTH